MKRRLLFLFAVFMVATSVGWGQNAETSSPNGKLTKVTLLEGCGKGGDEKYPSCFANGHPIRIYKGDNGSLVVATTDGTDSFTFTSGEIIVYGGSYEKKVEGGTSITIESGSVRTVYGGGRSNASDKPADVSGTAHIIIKGGTISNLLVGGGRYYAKTGGVNIETEGDEAVDYSIANIYVGGLDQGQTTNRLTTSLEESVNGVNTVTLNLKGGTISGGVGCGGGNGYTYTGKTTATFTNVKIASLYGVLANGRANDVDIKVTNCTFFKEGTSYRELAAVNRGALDHLNMTFDGCLFEEPGGINASLGAVDGWADSDTNGTPKPIVNGSVSFKFINSKSETPTFSVGRGLGNADIELIGAKASLKSFRDGTAVPGELSEFTLAKGKTWTFNDGIIIDQSVTFTKNGTLSSALTAEKLSTGIYEVYANGTPIEITSYSSDSVKITKQGQSTVIFKVPSGSSIYGGAKEAEVASTSVIFTSGKVHNLFGGGRSEKAGITANVTGTASIRVANGATVSNMLIGGGYWYSKAKAIDVNLQGASIAFFCVGGFDQGKTSNRIDTNLAQSVNGAETVKINVDGGHIELMGCGGGQGYSLTGISEVTLNNATIDCFYGTYSNGRAGTIIAKAKGCTFTEELAVLMRGKVGSGSFIFDGCSFGKQAVTPFVASLGAIDGWADSDTNGNPKPLVSEKVSFTFVNPKTEVPVMKIARGLESADIELNGAKALMTYFRDGSAVGNTSTDFKLAAGNTWAFNGGLSTEGDKYTFTKEGILKGKALTSDDLLVLASLHADTVTLIENTYELPSQLAIKRPMVLDGAGIDQTIIKASAADWSTTYDAEKNLVVIENDLNANPVNGTVKLSNLTIRDSKRSGLNAQSSMSIELDSIALINNAKGAGIVVHSSVKAKNLQTSGNGWGGVNIDKGTPAYPTCFTFDNTCSFAEGAKIYSEIIDDMTIVVAPDTWERLLRESQGKSFALWLERLIVPGGKTLTADATYAGRDVYIENGGILSVNAPLALGKVTMEEGAQLIPALITVKNKVTATTLQLNTSLDDASWKAFGFPKAFTLQTANGKTKYNKPTEDTNAETGAYFAGLKDETAPVFEYKKAFGTSGLLSADKGDYQVSATDVELKTEAEPDTPTTSTFILYANPNTYDMTLTKNKSVYVLDAAKNEFVQCTDAVKTLRPFECVVLTDAVTYNTLRSLRLGDNIVTGNQTVEPVDGYYVSTERGAIVIHTADAVDVMIIGMNGKVAYRGEATDGQRIVLPSGIYAVNGQLVRVK